MPGHFNHLPPPIRRCHRRRRRRGHAVLFAARECGLERGGAVEGVSDALAYGSRAGRHRRIARQHDRRQLVMAHVRYRQGFGLSGRPGRDRVHVPRSAARRLRARALRHAVRSQSGRHDLSAPVRRAFGAFRRKAGATCVRCGRSHRPRDAAYAVSAQRRIAHAVFRRMDGARPDSQRRRRSGRRNCA